MLSSWDYSVHHHAWLLILFIGSNIIIIVSLKALLNYPYSGYLISDIVKIKDLFYKNKGLLHVPWVIWGKFKDYVTSLHTNLTSLFLGNIYIARLSKIICISFESHKSLRLVCQPFPFFLFCVYVCICLGLCVNVNVNYGILYFDIWVINMASH